MILKDFLNWAFYQEKEMVIDLAKIHKFGLANFLVDSPMATWLSLTGTLRGSDGYSHNMISYKDNSLQ